MMTDQQAHAAMYHFLDGIWIARNSDGLAIMLGEMSMLSDGGTADPAFEHHWRDAIDHALALSAADRQTPASVVEVDGAAASAAYADQAPDRKLPAVIPLAENPSRKVTDAQAYAAMCHILDYYRRTFSADDLAALLGRMSLRAHGTPVDPALGDDWKEAVAFALNGGEAGRLILGPPTGEDAPDPTT